MYGDVEVEYHVSSAAAHDRYEVNFMFSVTLISKETKPHIAG
jgi:hypothetical protein